jgi:hypothetical protein
MPWLPVYTDRDDVAQLVAWLNAEEVIAFILPDGPDPEVWAMPSALARIRQGGEHAGADHKAREFFRQYL